MSKKILIAGYPKSGNTWLGYILSYILGAKYITADASSIKVTQEERKPTLNKRILEMIGGNLPHKSDYDNVCKTHDRYNYFSDTVGLESYDHIVHIVRDPCDVTVSYFFYNYYNSPVARGKPEDVLSRRPWFVRKYYWKKTVYKVACEWPMHTMSWRTFEGTKLVQYEDLHRDTIATIEKICDYLEFKCSAERLQEAVQLFSFDRLSGERKMGEEYSASFFRKGIVGDYQNHFDLVDTQIMRHYAGKEMRDLGYDI